MKQININDITETIKKFYDVACTYPFVTNPYIFALEQTLKVVMITSGEYSGDDLKDRLDEALNKLSADAVEVVRCRDCQYMLQYEQIKACCNVNSFLQEPKFVEYDDYCSRGERKDD